MKARAITAAMMLAAALAACDGGGEGCRAGEIRLPDGTCISMDGNSDSDVAADGAEEGAGDPGEGIEGIDCADGSDAETDGEEEPCERPCAQDSECEDDNVCTEDKCAPVTLCCVYFIEGTDYLPCGDGLYCNGIDYCYGGICVVEPLPGECTATSPCTSVECNEEADTCDSTPLADGTSCDDGLYCTGENNTCLGGYCEYISPCPNFTGNPCTVYQCNESEPHCVEIPRPNGESCADSDPCNGVEFCRDGECSLVQPSCFDGDVCSTDECVPGPEGCVHNPIPDCTICSDPSPCDDLDPCTDDYCRVVGGEVQCERFPRPAC